MPNPAKTKDSDFTMFLLGDVFLRQFYSEYDFEDQSVKLAVNVHAQSYVSITDRESPLPLFLYAAGATVFICLIAYVIITIRIKNQMKLKKQLLTNEKESFMDTESSSQNTAR